MVLDVRSRFEFEHGHVPGAIHVPFWKVGFDLDEVPAARNDEIVVYCGHGPRALWAAARLRSAGFERVTLLEGHWAQWVYEGRPQE